MSLPTFIVRLKQSALITCTPTAAGNRISLTFSTAPPAEPGVYAVYQRTPEKPFYVGEAGNLLQRLKMLFRCRQGENPHPCHTRHEHVYEAMPDVEDFCAHYAVRWLTTTQLIGRLEIEKAVQKNLGTNHAGFYEAYDPDAIFVPPDAQPAPACLGGAGCATCPLWQELSTNPVYQDMDGIEIATMGGRAENLLFRFDPTGQNVRVWREHQTPDFSFDETVCRNLCRRYQEGLNTGAVPPPKELGGTAFFGEPGWEQLPLGRINTPYAAAVIRHVWPLL